MRTAMRRAAIRRVAKMMTVAGSVMAILLSMAAVALPASAAVALPASARTARPGARSRASRSAVPASNRRE